MSPPTQRSGLGRLAVLMLLAVAVSVTHGNRLRSHVLNGGGDAEEFDAPPGGNSDEFDGGDTSAGMQVDTVPEESRLGSEDVESEQNGNSGPGDLVPGMVEQGDTDGERAEAGNQPEPVDDVAETFAYLDQQKAQLDVVSQELRAEPSLAAEPAGGVADRVSGGGANLPSGDVELPEKQAASPPAAAAAQNEEDKAGGSDDGGAAEEAEAEGDAKDAVVEEAPPAEAPPGDAERRPSVRSGPAVAAPGGVAAKEPRRSARGAAVVSAVDVSRAEEDAEAVMADMAHPAAVVKDPKVAASVASADSLIRQLPHQSAKRMADVDAALVDAQKILHSSE